MPREFKIDPPEGPYPQKPIRYREFNEDNYPFEIGNLEKEDFDYLGKWMKVMGKQGYGIMYRIAVKKGVKDDEDDITTLVFHFYNLIAKKGMPMTPEIVEQQLSRLKRVVQLFNINAFQAYGNNITSIILQLPGWMQKELEEIVNSK